jgi:hypothetical protein
MVSTIMRSELMRAHRVLAFSYVAEPYYMLADVAPADGPGQVALRAWPGLAARHTILDVIGCLLANRCQLEKLLFYG